jgi:hypothetical protein
MHGGLWPRKQRLPSAEGAKERLVPALEEMEAEAWAKRHVGKMLHMLSVRGRRAVSAQDARPEAGVEAVVSMEIKQPVIGQFSATVDDADALHVGGYLRRVGLLRGPGPNGHYRRKRREAALIAKRARRAAQRRGELARHRP